MRLILILAFTGLLHHHQAFGQSSQDSIYSKALEMYKKSQYDSAVAISKKIITESKDSIYLTRAYALIGVCYWVQEKNHQAIANFSKALDLAEKIGNDQYVARLSINIGEAYRKIHEYGKAREKLNIALQYHKDNQSKAAIMNNLGNIYLVQDQQDSAITMYQKALLYYDSKNRHTALNNIGLAYQYQSQYDSAYIYFSEAYQERKRRFSSNHPLTLRTQKNIAYCLSKQGYYDFAILLLKQLKGLAKGVASIDQFHANVYHADCLVKMGRREEAMEIYHKADSLVDHVRRSTKDKRDKLEISRIAHRLNEAAMEQCFKIKNYKKAFYFAERNKGATLLETTEAKYSLGYTSVISVADLQKKLLPGQAMLSYAYFGDSLATFLVSQDTFFVHRQLKGDLEKVALDYLKLVVNPFRVYEYLELASDLYARLIRPIENYLLGIDKLMILPDDQLYIPFEALLAKQPAKPKAPAHADYANYPYLINKYSISYHFSATLATIPKPDFVYHIDYLGYAPSFKGKYDELLFNTLEVQGVKEILKGSRRALISYVGDDANKFNFHTLISKTFHVATHHQPQGLMLADGIVSLKDLENIKIRTDLAVLAGCQTFGGAFVKGEGPVNLVSHFVESGADNVLFSFHKVHDKTTHNHILDFFQELKKGNTYNQALRKTKLSLIQEGYPLMFWVSFGLISKLSDFH